MWHFSYYWVFDNIYYLLLYLNICCHVFESIPFLNLIFCYFLPWKDNMDSIMLTVYRSFYDNVHVISLHRIVRPELEISTFYLFSFHDFWALINYISTLQDLVIRRTTIVFMRWAWLFLDHGRGLKQYSTKVYISVPSKNCSNWPVKRASHWRLAC